MKFSKQLDYHKIPEWSNDYLKYEELKESIYKFKKGITDGTCVTLDGYYILTSNQTVLKIDVASQPDSRVNASYGMNQDEEGNLKVQGDLNELQSVTEFLQKKMKAQQSVAVKFGDQVPNPLVSLEAQDKRLDSAVVDVGGLRKMNTLAVNNQENGLQYQMPHKVLNVREQQSFARMKTYRSQGVK